MSDSREDVRQLIAEAARLEDEATDARVQANAIIVEHQLCARGGDPRSHGRGFCCGVPYDCQGRQP